MAKCACVLVVLWMMVFIASPNVQAQSSAAVADQHVQHEHTQPDTSGGWQFMQDGVVFANFNHQGGPRGGSEFVVPNWWMGMAGREPVAAA